MTLKFEHHTFLYVILGIRPRDTPSLYQADRISSVEMLRELLLLLLPLCRALELPIPNGPYQFTLNVSELIDASRKDPWAKDTIDYRRLMISRFDPLPLNTSFCTVNAKIDYMSPNISAAMDGILTPFGIPAGMFSNLE